MWATVSPKEGKGGGPVRGRGMGVESLSNARKKEKRIMHKDGKCGAMPQPRENGVLVDSTQMASAGHVAK